MLLLVALWALNNCCIVFRIILTYVLKIFSLDYTQSLSKYQAMGAADTSPEADK